MTFTVKIKCDNAAFDPPEVEVAHLLREAANRIENGDCHGGLVDSNGNHVGEYKFSGRRVE